MPSRLKFLMGLVTFTAIVRLLPCLLTKYDLKLDSSIIFYPWHFVPLTAFCLYSGAYVSNRRWSLGLPMLAMLISDIGIWAITGQSFWTVPMEGWSKSAGLVVATFCYLVSVSCFAFTVFLGKGANRKSWPIRGLDAFGRGMLAEVIFFIATNFAYFWSQNDLPHTVQGLVTCFINAIPFAGNSFASTAFYSVLLFSPLAVRASAESRSTQSELQSAMAK